jgi:release factor glutamine methyltransferase
MSPHTPSTVITTLRAAGCVFAEDEARLLLSAAATTTDLLAMLSQRVAGLPLEHILGWAEFYGMRMVVDPGVFVPRRRTEFLVSQAARFIRHPPTVVVDLCCGSGAVGAALLAAHHPSAGGVGPIELHAVDIDPIAVRCARRNVAATGGLVHQGDLYQPLPERLRGRIDVLVVNAPHVPTDALGLLPPEARLHEAMVALDGGVDGLDVLRRVVAEAPRWLAPDGRLLAQVSRRQAPPLVVAAIASGLTPVVTYSEELDATVIIAS